MDRQAPPPSPPIHQPSPIKRDGLDTALVLACSPATGQYGRALQADQIMPAVFNLTWIKVGAGTRQPAAVRLTIVKVGPIRPRHYSPQTPSSLSDLSDRREPSGKTRPDFPLAQQISRKPDRLPGPRPAAGFHSES